MKQGRVMVARPFLISQEKNAMPITRAEFEQLETLSKETERMRRQLKELRQRSIVSAYNISGSRSGRGSQSDRVCDLVAARDELERKINRNRLAMDKLINKVYNPRDLLSSGTPLDMRVSTVLRFRHVDGMTWDEIGQRWGIKGATCKQMVRRYKKTLQ